MGDPGEGGQSASLGELAGRIGLLIFGERQGDPDLRTFADRALDVDRSAVVGDDAVGDGQAQSGPTFLQPGREEGVEDLVDDLFRDADALVTDLDHGSLCFAQRGDRHDLRPVGGLAGVANQIDEGLLELDRAPEDRGWMVEAVGHDHLGEFYWAVEQVLAPDGILVMEAITTTEERYENYLRSTDFINTIIFPGSCCPCLHALVDAAYQGSRLTLEHIDNIGLHYAQTLADWRRRFNANEELVRSLGFDDIFIRAWNYYLSYCEAGFYARNVNCLILVFSRNGCTSLTPLYETRACTQFTPMTEAEVANWISDGDN